MYTITKPFFLHSITSVHPGSGSEISVIDLPIQRERHTGYPKIEGSTLKGALRHDLSMKLSNEENERMEAFKRVFGSNPKQQDNNDSQASAISLIDARILLFPIRSLKGTFAWITCPGVLSRFNREMRLFMESKEASNFFLPIDGDIEKTVASNKIVVPEKNDKNAAEQSTTIVLEEYAIEVKESETTRKLAEVLEENLRSDLSFSIKDRLVILTDDQFADFVKMSTEVSPRIKVNDNGTTEGGALWYEENLPPETIFYSAVLIGKPKLTDEEASKKGIRTEEEVSSFIDESFPKVFQLGGNTTIGKGIMQLIWLKGAEINE